MKTISVNASKNYNVFIGAGELFNVGELLCGMSRGYHAAVVTDKNVNELYGECVVASLEASGFRTVKFIIEPGEASKNADNYVRLLNMLAASGLTRTDTVVALGGGVVGDLAGFAAATYMRGIHLMHLPTTLLAAVDSSIGGKTAIDLDSGKNLAGAFYQPDAVLCDTDTLKTLPPDILADGYAEVIKYAVIADAGLLDGDCIENTVARCVSIKRDIVQRDELETGERKLLNFGHTVGHAIERLSGYTISHGGAVAAGMAVITRAAERAGLCGGECYPAITGLLSKYGLKYETSYAASELANAALSDKKREGKTITIIVPKRIGECVLHTIAATELESFLAGGID